jgi:hypothetical protein
MAGAVFHLHVGSVGKAALETHLWFEKPDHLELTTCHLIFCLSLTVVLARFE